MISVRFSVCTILLLLTQPALAQTQQIAPAVNRPPVNQTVGPILQTAPALSGPSQTQRDEARREADNARIEQSINEARERADQHMDAADAEMATGVAAGVSQIVPSATAQRPAQGGQDIETLTQQTLSQTAQEANEDLRESMSAVQRENRRRRALREHAECLRNAANANLCPCPNGTEQVNGQCAAAGN